MLCTQVFNHDNFFFARWVFLRILWKFIVEYGLKLQSHWTGTNRGLNLDIAGNFELETFGKRTCFARVRFMHSLKTRHITCDCVLSVVKCWNWMFVCTYACRWRVSIHVCVCVCVRVFVYIYIYTHIRMYLSERTSVSVYESIRYCNYVCVCMYYMCMYWLL
jgi:hypothetical protein